MSPVHPRPTWLRVVVILLVAAGLTAPLVIWWEPIAAVFAQRERVVAAIRGAGAWGPALLIALYVAQVIAAPIPGQVVNFVAGYLYGFGLGSLYSWLGMVIGSAAAMALARLAGRPLVVRLVNPTRLDRLDRLAAGRGLGFFFLVFLIPGLPDDAVCFLAGLTPLPLPALIAAAAVGRIPGIVAAVWAGAYAGRLPWQGWLIGGGISLVAAVLLWRYGHRVQAALMEYAICSSEMDMSQTIEVTLDAIAHGGEAGGRHAGKVIFVPYAIPGERVQVEIVEEKERWARARLLAVLIPSPDRVEPPCPYFGPEACGGCQWQYIAYERQAELKREIVVDQLRRLGRIANPPVVDTLVLAAPSWPENADAVDSDTQSPMPEKAGHAVPNTQYLSYGYRNYVQFAVTGDGRLGYRRDASHEIIAIDHCLLLDDRLDELRAALDVAGAGLTGVSLRAGINTDQALILFETAGNDAPELEIELPAACALLTPAGVQPLIGEPWIEEEVAGRRCRISAESFFPVNTAGAEALVAVVTEYAQLRPDDVLLNAYCGVGLFALALADSAAEVIGIESAAAACEDFAINAGDRANVTLHEGAIEEVLPALGAQGQRVDVAVIDPPRTGAGPAVIRELAALGPRRIVYVSCDPASLARDAAPLAAAGYRLVEAQPVDMFPQTYHVETVALWEK
ncbi:MAG: VTT domain-containing protein [Chloroflexi bacterium]|nr:VTT domain-containing protein [Chloroflexota bacterium]